MTRSKALAVLLILSVALAGGLQALSVVPHVHGHDVDHSAHSTCPVHQAQGQNLQTVEIGVFLPAFADLRSEAVFPASTGFTYQTFLFQKSLRAPPVSF